MRPEDSSVAIIQGVNAPHQFSYENGIVLTDVGPGYAKGELIIGPDSINPHGNVHGGALSTLADTVGGCCACSKGGSCVTSGCSIEYLRPANGSKIYCTATPKKLGRTLSVVALEMTNDQGAVVATATYTFFMMHIHINYIIEITLKFYSSNIRIKINPESISINCCYFVTLFFQG